MTDDERALLIAVAKAIASGLDTPWATRRALQDLVTKVLGAS